MKKNAIMAVLVQSCFMMQSVAWAADQKAVQDLMHKSFAGLGAGLVLMYFVPTFIGFVRKKDNKMAILLLNLFLGWSLIGWVVALIWAVSKDKRPQTIIINK